MYSDIELTCRDCSMPFTFTAGQQEFFATKGFDNQPSRCKDCQSARKQAMGGGGGGYGREGLRPPPSGWRAHRGGGG